METDTSLRRRGKLVARDELDARRLRRLNLRVIDRLVKVPPHQPPTTATNVSRSHLCRASPFTRGCQLSTISNGGIFKLVLKTLRSERRFGNKRSGTKVMKSSLSRSSNRM